MKNLELMLSDCIQDFAPVGDGVRNKNSSLNELCWTISEEWDNPYKTMLEYEHMMSLHSQRSK